MKSLKYAVILLLGLSMTFLASCTKDPDNGGNGGNNGGGNNGGGSNYTELIIGKWKAANSIGEDWLQHPSHIHVNEGETFTFTADGLTTFPQGIAVDYIIASTPVVYENLNNPGDVGDYPNFLELCADGLGVETSDLEDGYWISVGDDDAGLFFIEELTNSTLKLVAYYNGQERLVLTKI